MRSCNGCRLCCKLFPVPTLGKAADEWCRFAVTAGCSIHDGPRPTICGEYTCYWLEHEELPDELRPDRVGIVLTDWGMVPIAGEVVRVIAMNEADAGAGRERGCQALLNEMVARGRVVLVLGGPDMQVEYDRSRYPMISVSQIEAALRQHVYA